MAKDYRSYSFWLETSGDDLTPRPALDGTIDADVAILGAGYTGLWTAYYLLERDPSLKVVILEKEIAGFGASGRNGGGLGNRFPIGLRRVSELLGRQRSTCNGPSTPSSMRSRASPSARGSRWTT
jgi:hypothetical protein